jgi:hypothetical protein
VLAGVELGAGFAQGFAQPGGLVAGDPLGRLYIADPRLGFVCSGPLAVGVVARAGELLAQDCQRRLERPYSIRSSVRRRIRSCVGGSDAVS